jgi:AbrB family looped-hinge helix DNA binding protein
MRVTEKGQVTIPKEIRDHLGIQPGSEVDFIPSRDGALLVVASPESAGAAARKFREWAGQVEGMLDLDGQTTDEFMAWIRGERDDVDAG